MQLPTPRHALVTYAVLTPQRKQQIVTRWSTASRWQDEKQSAGRNTDATVSRKSQMNNNLEKEKKPAHFWAGWGWTLHKYSAVREDSKSKVPLN
jgi:hypothetical protein